MAKLRLVIEMDEKGEVSLGGPLNDRPTCYALLGFAREYLVAQGVKELQEKEDGDEGGRIVVPKFRGPGIRG